MKLLHIVTWSFQYDEDYIVDVVIHNCVLEAWLYRKDYSVKMFLYGVKASDIGFDDFVYQAGHYIEENDCIKFYEDEYVDEWIKKQFMKNIEQLNVDELRKEVYRLQKFERIILIWNTIFIWVWQKAQTKYKEEP